MDEFIKDCRVLSKLMVDTAIAYNMIQTNQVEGEKAADLQFRINSNSDLIPPLWGKVNLFAYDFKIPFPQLKAHDKQSVFDWRHEVEKLLTVLEVKRDD